MIDQHSVMHKTAAEPTHTHTHTQFQNSDVENEFGWIMNEFREPVIVFLRNIHQSV